MFGIMYIKYTSKYGFNSNSVNRSGLAPGKLNPLAIPKPTVKTIILTINNPLKNLANKYSSFVKGYEYNMLCILLLKSRYTETPIIEGYKKIMRELTAPNKPPNAYGEFTISDEPTVTVTASNMPAAEPEIIREIKKKMRQ
tara:strand:+ start:232 stop:654 length:423 start_codon:yes stop_codon:yes gene_type:complete